MTMIGGSMSNENPHSEFPGRENKTVTVRGQTMPGWFTGPAAVWTGGHAPRVIGPFPDVESALKYQTDHAPGAKVFPIDPPESA